jgi:hypothetical protein
MQLKHSCGCFSLIASLIVCSPISGLHWQVPSDDSVFMVHTVLFLYRLLFVKWPSPAPLLLRPVLDSSAGTYLQVVTSIRALAALGCTGCTGSPTTREIRGSAPGRGERLLS